MSTGVNFDAAPQVIIRSAAPADASQIASIWNHYIANTLATFTNAPKSDADIAALIEAAPAVLVAQAPGSGGAIQGFGLFQQFRGGPGYAKTMEPTLYLRAGATGLGAGAQLLGALEAHAKAQGMAVFVAGISSANAGSVRFFERSGYRNAGFLRAVGRKNDRWLDLHLLEKDLRDPDILLG